MWKNIYSCGKSEAISDSGITKSGCFNVSSNNAAEYGFVGSGAKPSIIRISNSPVSGLAPADSVKGPVPERASHSLDSRSSVVLSSGFGASKFGIAIVTW